MGLERCGVTTKTVAANCNSNQLFRLDSEIEEEWYMMIQSKLYCQEIDRYVTGTKKQKRKMKL